MKLTWYWHIHHGLLVEPLTEPIENRILYIKTAKPEGEIELRLKLLKPVKGKIPIRIVKAKDAYDKARNKAWDVYDSWDDHYKAWNKAKDAYDKVVSASPALAKLHKKECPNCPWDGKTIV